MAKPFQVLKPCKCCGENKSLDSFTKNLKGGDKFGLNSYCKDCKKKKDKVWADNNRDKTRMATKTWYERNRLHASEYGKQWRAANKDRKAVQVKNWGEKNKDKLREYSKRGNLKRRSTLSGRINDAFSSAMYRSLKSNKGGRHWEDLVGYTVEDLKKHIENQFEPGMNWENYGKFTWHIDHKIPMSAFNISSAECIDFKKCWKLSNLQPLWARENHVKRDRLKEPFQPSLALEVTNG
jgi:hypothetical protein